MILELADNFGSNVLKKIALAPSRNAFLLLVKMNVLNFANRLAANNQSALKNKWEKLGGNWNKLNTAINQGKTIQPSKPARTLPPGAYYDINGNIVSGNQIAVLKNGVYINSDGTTYQPGQGRGLGEPVSATAAIGAATAVIVALKEFLKTIKPSEPDIIDVGINPEMVENVSEGTTITDPETTNSLLNPKVLLIGGGLLALLFLSKKK